MFLPCIVSSATDMHVENEKMRWFKTENPGFSSASQLFKEEQIKREMKGTPTPSYINNDQKISTNLHSKSQIKEEKYSSPILSPSPHNNSNPSQTPLHTPIHIKSETKSLHIPNAIHEAPTHSLSQNQQTNENPKTLQNDVKEECVVHIMRWGLVRNRSPDTKLSFQVITFYLILNECLCFVFCVLFFVFCFLCFVFCVLFCFYFVLFCVLFCFVFVLFCFV
jgi:hypothetical protein